MNKYIKLNNLQRFAVETHFNGNQLENIYFNGNEIEKVYFNENLVFEKVYYIIDYNLTTDGSN